MLSRRLIILAVILLPVLAFQFWLVGRQPVIKLGPAPEFAGLVAQSMQGGGKAHKLPVAGKDFNLTDLTYFENRTWLAASITPIKNRLNSALVILQQKDGSYQVVLGPGSAFDSSYLYLLPKDVGQYLSSHGAIYGTVNQ